MKAGNGYADVVRDIYARTPKAVWAAIAVSYASTGGDYPGAALPNILREWWALHHNGIVPQKPCEPEPDDARAGK